MSETGRLIVAMTGASGAIYGIRFLEQAARHYETIYLAVSEQALQVINTELGRPVTSCPLSSQTLLGAHYDNIVFLDRRDYFSPPASGSFRHDGMVIIPCSMGTAGRIAHGISDDLVARAADVCLKEHRRLILVIRETPWSLIHLRNLTRLAEAGATVLPASPSFYYRPTTIEALVDTVIARVLQQLGIAQEVMPQWQFTENP
jgi:4-hydroxy-3-polyprenylbenzoate decarboxylase